MSETERKGPLRHGILAAAVLVDHTLTGNTPEDRDQFEALLDSLVEYYAPNGPVEEMLLEQIAVAYWRQRRVLWFESAQVASNVDGAGNQAIKATDHLDSAADDLWERAEAIRKAGKLSPKELQAAQDYLHRSPTDPEEWAHILECLSRGNEAEADAQFNREVKMRSTPDFSDGRWDLIIRYDKHLTNTQLKLIDRLIAMQAARRPEAGTGMKRKPRRGASRAKPRFALVMGGR